jgi:hypothetical protein
MTNRNTSRSRAKPEPTPSALIIPFPRQPNWPPCGRTVTISDNNSAWNDGFKAGLDCIVAMQEALGKKGPT